MRTCETNGTYVAAQAGVGGAHHVLGLERLLSQLRPVVVVVVVVGERT